MAATVPSNLYATAAAQIVANASRTSEQKLLEKAIQNVRQRYPTLKLPASVIDDITNSPKAEDIVHVFDKLRSGNKVLRSSAKDSIISRLGRCADTVLNFKDFGTNLAQINQTVAAPVWGVLCATLATLQNILKTDEALDLIRQRLHDWLDRFSTLHSPAYKLSDHLMSKILFFYEIVIEFTFNVASVFQHTTARSTFEAASRLLLNEVESFSQRLNNAANNVDIGVNYEILHAVQERNRSYALSPIQQTPLPQTTAQASQSLCQKYHVPGLSRCFVGRAKEVSSITHSLIKNISHDCPRVALYGISGVGKSQTAIQYAEKYRIEQPDGIYSFVFFIDASDRTRLLQQFSILAQELGLVHDGSMAGKFEDIVVSKIKEKLRTLSKWILIFDNVSRAHDLDGYIPDCGDGHIIITTKSKIDAKSLTYNARDMIEIEKLEVESFAIDLVLEAAPINLPVTPDDISKAREIAIFADGLPLAMEQIVALGEYSGKGWKRALETVEQKLQKMSKNISASTFDHDLPTAAIVATAMECLASTNEKAAELFKVLVYLDTSSIPLGLLHDMTSGINDHNRRRVGYDRGSRPAPRGRGRAELQLTEAESKFNLYDYDPFSFEVFRRLAHRGKYSKKVKETDLPRADSPSDIELEKLWRRGEKVIQVVLEDPVNTDNAINILVDIGIARRLDSNSSAIWIHDLFALMGRTLIEHDSSQRHKSTAHLAATLVYLSFPIPQLPDPDRAVDRCLKSLPHAVAVHAHLKRFGILNDATIGPELSHLIASTIHASGRKYALRQNIMEYAPKAIEYYQDAYSGYLEAWKRLHKLKGIDLKRVMLSVYNDYLWEELAGYVPARHLRDYERFGGSAPWRCVSTLTKVGSLFVDIGEHSKAISFLETSAKMTLQLFGQGHEDTIAVLNLLMQVHMDQENWPAAYDAARRKATASLHVEELPEKYFGLVKDKEEPAIVGLRDSSVGATICYELGTCCLYIPGRERDAVLFFGTELAARQSIDKDSPGLWHGAMQRLAQAHANAGNMQKQLYWLGMALDVILQDAERPESSIWGRRLHRFLDDQDVVDSIERFRAAQAQVADLDDHLSSMIRAWETSALLWELKTGVKNVVVTEDSIDFGNAGPSSLEEP